MPEHKERVLQELGLRRLRIRQSRVKGKKELVKRGIKDVYATAKGREKKK